MIQRIFAKFATLFSCDHDDQNINVFTMCLVLVWDMMERRLATVAVLAGSSCPPPWAVARYPGPAAPGPTSTPSSPLTRPAVSRTRVHQRCLTTHHHLTCCQERGSQLTFSADSGSFNNETKKYFKKNLNTWYILVYISFHQNTNPSNYLEPDRSLHLKNEH